MKNFRIALFLLFLFFVYFSCSSTQTITDTGTIIYLDFEGGFYGIVGDSGGNYDPINLPHAFEVDSLRVKFTAKIRPDLGSYHMWGTIVELISIAAL